MTEATSGQMHTALQCFVAIARQHEVDLSVEGLIHDHALVASDDPAKAISKIAPQVGFRSRKAKLAWSDLGRLGDAYPVIAELDNGNSVILAGWQETEAGPRIAVFDPLAQPQGVMALDEATFAASWSGQILLVKRAHRLLDKDQPFGFGWFVPMALDQMNIFRDIVVAGLTLQVLALAVPIFVQIVLDKVLSHQTYATLYVLTAGVIIALLFEGAFTFLRRYLLLFATNKIDIRTASRTFRHLLSLPIDFFEKATAGVLVQHMQQTEKVREFLTGRLFLTLLDTASLFIVLPLLFFYSGLLAVVVLCCSGLMVLIIASLLAPFRRRLRRLYEAEGERQAFLVETIHGMDTIKSLALEPRRQRNWDSRAAVAVNSRFRLGKISAAAQSATGSIEKLLTVLIVSIGCFSVFDGAMTAGALIAFQMLAARVTGPLTQIVGLVHEYQEAALSVRMLGQIMDQRSETGATRRGIRPQVQGHIQFENVTFRYSSGASPALDGVSFTVPPHTILGVVGRSGSGKTTLTRLLRGMYATQTGIVRVDGQDIREIDLPHLRSNIGVVLQDSFLFRGTVRENIGAGRPDASAEEIAEAAALAGADEFIETLPKGYDTPLDENGGNLSGGQRQRIAIARALLRHPSILVFDEATSALDPESETIIQQNLARIAAGRTVIIVSHRLASLVTADAILVLEKGKVVDLGRHNELLGRCASYRHLWNQQHRHLREAERA